MPSAPTGLVLASTSPSRLRLLRMVGIEPEVIAPEVDEEAVAAVLPPGDPAALVQALACAKAEEVLPRLAGRRGLVLACDSMFVLDGEVLGKPLRPEIAVARWRAMRGRTGVLVTGHRLVDHRTGAPGERVDAVASAEVTFAEPTDREIDAYIATGEPLHVAGAFTLEGRAAPFISRVVGDPHAVVGLSIASLRLLAGRLGIGWDELAG